MRKLFRGSFFTGLILSMLVVTSVFAETEKRVDGKRVETYKRVTVKGGSLVMTNSKTDADYAETSAAADSTRYSDNLVTMTADPVSTAEVSGGFFRVNKTAGSNGVYIINGLEGVVGSSYADEAGTFRGVYGRTYTNADATSTMRTAVAGEFSPRASYAGGTECIAESGTAFIGARIWMAPYFSAASVDNVNNFWGLWIYGEHASQRNADAAIKISTAGGGFTDDIILQSGDALTNSAAGTIVASGALQSGKAGTDGALKIYSEQGTTDYLVTINPNAAMTSNANFYLPADEAGAESFLKMGTDGVIDYDTNLYATTTLNNLGTTAINASLLPGVAGAVNLGSEALFFGTANIGTALVFEGVTDDAFQTTIGVVDPTTPDKTINFPNASGTVAVSATAPITLSALGDVGLTLAKDIVASGTGMSGGADDVLPGADADVTITLTTLKDMVAGTGLSGGENDVLPGADADTTISLDLAAANVWTGAHSFQVASPQITLGKDETSITPNIVGGIKMFSAGDNAYFSTLTAGTNTSNAAFTLPIDEPAATYLLNMTSGGQIGYDSSVYIVTETDPLSATKALNNLDSVAINTSLISDLAATDDLGTEALYWRKLYLGSDISFEGASDDTYQTTLTTVDVTDSDKSINIPNASGTMAVSATAPATLSVFGDIGVTVAKDLVTSAPLSGGTDDILVGADGDVTLSIDNISYTLLADGTDGNLITWDSAGAPALVATGDAAQVLTSNGAGAAPTFAAIPTLNQNTTGSAKNLTTGQHLKFTIVDPATAYTKSTTICIWNKTDAAIHIKNIEFRCNADPTTEPTGDIKYADDLIGLGTPTLIGAFDTTAGTFSSGAINVAVASGKCIYLSYDAAPDAATTQHAVDINWLYD